MVCGLRVLHTDQVTVKLFIEEAGSDVYNHLVDLLHFIGISLWMAQAQSAWFKVLRNWMGSLVMITSPFSMAARMSRLIAFSFL